MADPETTRNRREGAGSYGTAEEGAQEIRPKVGVYDRPADAGKRSGGGMNMMTILIAVIVLLVLGAIVWNVLT